MKGKNRVKFHLVNDNNNAIPLLGEWTWLRLSLSTVLATMGSSIAFNFERTRCAFLGDALTRTAVVTVGW